jgi:hypothetical protein
MAKRDGLSLDHVFLTVSRGGPEVEPLLEAGFTEGAPNVHSGQGTACRRFFFENAYLEFVWVENQAEAEAPAIAPTGLARRGSGDAGASRVGVCVRLSAECPDPPVETWAYRPPYLKPGQSIPVGRNSGRVEEPLLFFMPPDLTQDLPTPRHQNGVRRISRVSLVLRSRPELSPEMKWLTESGLLRCEPGESEALRIEFDDGVRGGRLALDPELACEMSW